MGCSPSVTLEAASLSISPQTIQLDRPVRISCATSHNKTSIYRVELEKQIGGVGVILGDLSPGKQEIYIPDGALPKGIQLRRIDRDGSFGIELLIEASNWSDSTVFTCKVSLWGRPRASISKNLTVYGMQAYTFSATFSAPAPAPTPSTYFRCHKPGFPDYWHDIISTISLSLSLYISFLSVLFTFLPVHSF